jgi:hypothetical protein
MVVLAAVVVIMLREVRVVASAVVQRNKEENRELLRMVDLVDLSSIDITY